MNTKLKFTIVVFIIFVTIVMEDQNSTLEQHSKKNLGEILFIEMLDKYNVVTSGTAVFCC